MIMQCEKHAANKHGEHFQVIHIPSFDTYGGGHPAVLPRSVVCSDETLDKQASQVPFCLKCSTIEATVCNHVIKVSGVFFSMSR